jgi:hypothetical protein
MGRPSCIGFDMHQERAMEELVRCTEDGEVNETAGDATLPVR